MAYQRIMVPLDGSDLALVALADALELCRGLGALLTVLHVREPRVGSSEAGQRYLDYVCEQHIPAAVAVAALVREGPVAATILQVAASEQIDLLVMATHGRSGLQRAVYGSVAEQILRSSTLPTLLVRALGRGAAAT